MLSDVELNMHPFNSWIIDGIWFTLYGLLHQDLWKLPLSLWLVAAGDWFPVAGTIATAISVPQFVFRRSSQLLAAQTHVWPWGTGTQGWFWSLRNASFRSHDTILRHVTHVTFLLECPWPLCCWGSWMTWIKQMQKLCWATRPSGSLRTWGEVVTKQVENPFMKDPRK